MWSRAVLVSLAICYTTSQPLEDSDNVRSARQLDLSDCCPCPDRSTSPATSVDDCPCRSADTEGASSLLFPTVLRPRPTSKAADSKEDSKNLLDPEVGLATSVLETLREVTDEEYQDALARDAARAAKTDFESRDATGDDTNRNLVTIIVNPKETDSFDDVLSEASHVQETRCISPLGSYRSNDAKMRKPTPQPSNLLRDIFMFPKPKAHGLLHRNLLDMDSDLGASNVQERVIDSTDGMNTRKGLRLKDKPLFKLFHNNRDLPKSLLSKPRSDYDNNENTFDSTNSNSMTTNRDGLTSTPKLRSISRPFNLRNEIQSRRELANSDQSFDLSQAPSNIKNQLSEDGSEMMTTTGGLGSLLKKHPGNSLFLQKNTNRLKNLMKLKDVELIPPMNSRKNLGLNRLNVEAIANKPSGIITDNRTSKPKNILSDFRNTGIKFNFNRQSSINDDDTNVKLTSAPFDRSNNMIKQDINIISDTQSSASNDMPQLIATNEECRNDGETNQQIHVADKSINSIADAASSVTDSDEEDTNIPSTNIKNADESVLENCNVEAGNDPQSSLRDMVSVNDNIADAVPSASENHSNMLTSDVENSSEALDNVSEQNIETIQESKQETNSESERVVKEVEQEQIQHENSVNGHTDDVKDEQEKSDPTNSLTSNSKECLENLSQDMRAETNHDDYRMDNTISPETEPETELMEDDEPIIANEDIKIVSNESTKEISPLSKALSNIRENVRETLVNLKKTNDHVKSHNHHIEKLRENVEKSAEEGSSIISDSPDFILDVATEPNTSIINDGEGAPTSSDSVTIEDLQKLSDSLLDLSSQNERETARSNENDIETTKAEEESVDKFNKLFNEDSEASATSFIKNESAGIDEVRSNDRGTDNNTCLSNIDSPMKLSLDETMNTLNLKGNDDARSIEMDTEASDPIVNVLPHDPLNLFKTRESILPDIIAQPPSLLNSDSNILKLPSIDLSNLGLPTLDDLKSSLSSLNIFDAVATDRSSDNTNEEFSQEMMSAASSPIFQSQKLPIVKNLEDVNLDIFKSKPLQPKRVESKFKSSNFNLQNTKLSASKNIDSKPLKWQSTLGEKKGLLGMSLPVNPNSRSEIPLLRSESVLPSFDDIRESMRSNVQNFINRDAMPLPRSLSAISDDIKYHTEDALRNAQKTMKSLKQRPLSDLNVFGNPTKRPHDILDLAHRTREDVEDKLKALHYDFNDRLTSMRENLFIPSGLESLHTPIFTDHNRKPSKNLKFKPFERKASTVSKPLSDRRNLKVSNAKLSRTNGKTLDKGETKLHKMLTAPSDPQPKTAELKPTKFPFFKQNLKSVEIKPKSGFDDKSKLEMTRSFNKPSFHKKNTIEITFSTTPRPVLISGTENLFANNKKSSTTSDFNSSLGRSRMKPLKLSQKDSKGSPSDLSPIQVAASSSRGAVNIDDVRLITAPASTEKPKPRTTPPLLRQLTKNTENNSRPTKLTSRVPTLAEIPKDSKRINIFPSIENTFLSKLRDAVNARLSNLDPIFNPTKKDNTVLSSEIKTIPSSNDVDMTRSASENLETIIVEEPFKEKVSYKCRMVCTKE